MIIVIVAVAIRYQRKLRGERTTLKVSFADTKHPHARLPAAPGTTPRSFKRDGSIFGEHLFFAIRRRNPAMDETTDIPPFSGWALPISSGFISLSRTPNPVAVSPTTGRGGSPSAFIDL